MIFSVDSTGAQWCYVPSVKSTCQDLQQSARFPHNPWSYQACSTPARGTTQCPAATHHQPYPPHHHPYHPPYHHPYHGYHHPYHPPIVTVVEEDAAPNSVIGESTDNTENINDVFVTENGLHKDARAAAQM